MPPLSGGRVFGRAVSGCRKAASRVVPQSALTAFVSDCKETWAFLFCKRGAYLMLLTGADIFAEVLVEQGVDTLFGYPGGAVLNLYDSLYHYRDKIHHVMTAHEQGAAHAADGYARATGKTGVVLATSGPGATNLVT